MIKSDNPSSPRPLDYATPVPRAGLSRPTAIVLATLCFIIGIPLCAIGLGVLTAVTGFNDRDLWRSLGFIAFGAIFCFAGMRLKRRAAVAGESS
jgi:hypothetical protein